MKTRRLVWLLLLVSTVFLAFGCAHGGAQTQGALLTPLDAADCYEGEDAYTSGRSSCVGFVYGDYEHYPSVAPSTRQVTLSGDRHHETRVVTRPSFGEPPDSSAVSGWSSFADSNSGASSATPRMDPVVVSAPAAPPVVSRQH